MGVGNSFLQQLSGGTAGATARELVRRVEEQQTPSLPSFSGEVTLPSEEVPPPAPATSINGPHNIAVLGRPVIAREASSFHNDVDAEVQVPAWLHRYPDLARVYVNAWWVEERSRGLSRLIWPSLEEKRTVLEAIDRRLQTQLARPALILEVGASMGMCVDPWNPTLREDPDFSLPTGLIAIPEVGLKRDDFDEGWEGDRNGRVPFSVPELNTIFEECLHHYFAGGWLTNWIKGENPLMVINLGLEAGFRTIDFFLTEKLKQSLLCKEGEELAVDMDTCADFLTRDLQTYTLAVLKLFSALRREWEQIVGRKSNPDELIELMIEVERRLAVSTSPESLRDLFRDEPSKKRNIQKGIERLKALFCKKVKGSKDSP